MSLSLEEARRFVADLAGVMTLVADLLSHIRLSAGILTTTISWLARATRVDALVTGPADGPGRQWFHIRQNKHHRWSLDESQIYQYHLAGALHPHVRWWEAMEVYEPDRDRSNTPDLQLVPPREPPTLSHEQGTVRHPPSITRAA